MHLGVILDESPDYLQDQAFSGIDIYAMATLGVAGVKYNREDIKELKSKVSELEKSGKTISDFGVESITSEKIWVKFSDDFKNQLNGANPVVTVSPSKAGVNMGVYQVNQIGFMVETERQISLVTFNWIAMAKVNNIIEEEQEKNTPAISPDLLNQLKVDESRKAPIKAYWEEQKLKNLAESTRQAKEQEKIAEIGKNNSKEHPPSNAEMKTKAEQSKPHNPPVMEPLSGPRLPEQPAPPSQNPTVPSKELSPE